MIYEPQKLFDAVAVSTGTYKSAVVSARTRNLFISGGSTSTAVGVITVKFNDLNENDYRAALGIATSATPTPAQDAANDTGWKKLSVYYIDEATGLQTTTGTIEVGAAGTFSFRVKKGPMRIRLEYAWSSGAGDLSAMANANEVA